MLYHFADSYINYRQFKALNKKSPPAALKAQVDQDTFIKSQNYARDRLKLSFFKTVYQAAKQLLYVKYDLFPKIWNLSGIILKNIAPFLPKSFVGTILQAVIFENIQFGLNTVMSLPLDLYANFIIEAKHGFNKYTLKSFLIDQLKIIVFSSIIHSIVAAGISKVIDYFGLQFVFYSSAFLLLFLIFLYTVIPVVIIPWIYKMTSLENGELRNELEALTAKVKFPSSNLFVIDGSSKSSHSNAFFSGLPWSKQIVLYDTLIESASTDEIVAVLAHEIGHWKLNHILQLLIGDFVQSVVNFYLFLFFLNNKSFYNQFGFGNVRAAWVAFTIYNLLIQPVELLNNLALNQLTRRNEYLADEYAKELGYSDALARALIILDKENLTSTDPDWLYSCYKLSHPSLTERLSAIGYVSEKKIT